MDKLYTAKTKYLFLFFIFSTVTSGFSQSFTETFDDDPGFYISSNDFTNDGIRYQVNGTNPNYENTTSNSTYSLSEGGAGDYAIQFDIGGSAGISEITVSLSSGENFSLSSLSFDIIADANITFSSSSGGNVSIASNNSSEVRQNYDFSTEAGFNNITSFTISGGNIVVDLDDISYSLVIGNTTPTASSFVAENGPYENLTYVFGTGDFGYSDADGDVLDHIIIQSLPTSGTLFADGNNDDTYDGGEELNVGDPVSKADLDSGNLQYIQNGSTNTSFQFNVSDGTDASTANYTVSLNVSPVPTVTLSVNPISKPENQTTPTIITATLSNSYGANTTVNLTTGGTTISMVDYALSDTEINISAGSTSETVLLQNINDNLYENDETVILDIGSISNGRVDESQQVTYTIINDDAPPNASLEILDVYNPITTESGGQAFVRGKIDNPTGATVSIPLSFSGTATGGGTDYAITGSVITISPGEVRDSIRVTSLFDELEEGDETIIIDMDTPTNAVESGTQQVTLTIKDANLSPPSGYSVSIDQVQITAANQTNVSFTLSGAEVGATYNYTFSSDGGGTNVTGSGTVSTPTDQITGIDLSNIADGTITLSTSLEDPAGNIGASVTDTSVKETNIAPTASDVAVGGTLSVGEQLTGNYTFSDADGDPESNSTFLWYRSDDESGSGKTEISGAVSSQYTLQTADQGKYISFAVTPNDGIIAGPQVESPIVGPVKMDQMITFSAIDVKTYGDAPFVLGDAQTDQGLTVNYTATDPSIVEIIGNQATILKAGITSITATQAGDDQTNPAVEVTQTLTVNKAMLSVTADAKSKTYGEPDPEFTYQASGFVNGEDETSLNGILSIDRVTGEAVGNYAITASGYLSDNYTIDYIDGSLEITQAPLVITADSSLEKVYGDPDPEFTYQASGFVNGDDIAIVTGALSRTAGEDVGNYPIILGSLSGGTNYELDLETADFEIVKADQDIAWDQDLSFGCDSDSQRSLTASASSGLAVTYTVTNTSIAEVTGDVLSANASGTTTIIAQQLGDENHHPAHSVEKVVSVSQNGLIRQHWDDVLVFDNSSGDFVSYQWYKNGAPVAGATKQYYSENGTLSGSYYAQATTQGGEVIISCVLELSGEHFTKSVRLVPNPVRASSEFVVDCSFDEATLSGASISVIDLNGRLMQTVSVTGSKTSLTAPTQRGVYVVVLSLGDGTRKTVNLLVN